MAVKRDIKYLNKDFSTLRASLIDYAKTYFPTTYNDFSPSSPGMMFMEMATYVGDVMSFYLDNQIQETYLQYARQTDNLFELAYMFGYKPNVTGVATTTIDFYQQIPSKLLNTIKLANTSIIDEVYNGFTFSIVEKQFSPTLNQKIGQAKNSQGIVLLQTEPSFTQDPQVLIEELKLIIDRDNLKAN